MKNLVENEIEVGDSENKKGLRDIQETLDNLSDSISSLETYLFVIAVVVITSALSIMGIKFGW